MRAREAPEAPRVPAGRMRRRGRRHRPERGDPPGAVFWSLGLLLPIALGLGGGYCLRTDAFFLPIRGGQGFDVAGEVADGLGVIALGLALLFHGGFFLLEFPSLRRVAIGVMFVGGLGAGAGFISAAF